MDRTRLQRVEPRPTPRHATTNAPAAPEFEPRDEVAVNHAEMIGVQWLTLMARLPTRMSNVAEDAGRSQERQSKRGAQRLSAEAKNGAEKAPFGGALPRCDSAGRPSHRLKQRKPLRLFVRGTAEVLPPLLVADRGRGPLAGFQGRGPGKMRLRCPRPPCCPTGNRRVLFLYFDRPRTDRRDVTRRDHGGRARELTRDAVSRRTLFGQIMPK